MIEFLEQRIAPAALHFVGVGGINETNGAILKGNGMGWGLSVQMIPDLNGDGIDDLLVANDGQLPEGSTVAWVVYGRETPFPDNFKLTKMKAAQGFKVLATAGLGAVKASGSADLNGDGLQDLIFAAPSVVTGVEELGATIVLYGSAAFGKKVDLSTVTASTGVVITGALHKGAFGNGSSAGDVNGDGVEDLIVSAPGEYYYYPGPIPTGPVWKSPEGAAYVIFGSASLPATLSASELDGTNGFAIKAFTPQARLSGAAAGDLNGDGFGDVAVTISGSSKGGIYVLYGRAEGFDSQVDIAALTAENGMRVATKGDTTYLSGTMTALGDVNGDGKDDLGVVVNYSGVAYVLYGQDNFGSSIDLATASKEKVFRFRGFGDLSFRPVGDWNRDGITDFAIVDSSFRSIPQVSMIFGSENLPAEMSELDLDGISGFGFRGHEGVISNGGDLNGDGQVDLAFGFLKNKNDTPGAGSVKLYFGSELTISSNGKKAAWSDPDGDVVTLKTSRGSFQPEDFTFGLTGVLEKLDLSDARFEGTTITSSVKRASGGDGRTAIGFIDADGVDLKSVSIKGDVGRIWVGDLDFSTPGLKKFSVDSLGRFGVETQSLGDQSPESVVNGILGRMTVRHDIHEVTLAAQQIDRLNVGGSIVGSADSNARILVAGMPATHLPTAAASLAATPAAIGSLTVQGMVQFAQILVGFDRDGEAVNPAVRVEEVAVRGDWQASSLSVGIASGPDGFYGSTDDFRFMPANGYLLGHARLESLRIDGQVYGSPASGDQFGIVSQEIRRATVSGERLGSNRAWMVYELASTGDVLLSVISRS